MEVRTPFPLGDRVWHSREQWEGVPNREFHGTEGGIARSELARAFPENVLATMTWEHPLALMLRARGHQSLLLDLGFAVDHLVPPHLRNSVRKELRHPEPFRSRRAELLVGLHFSRRGWDVTFQPHSRGEVGPDLLLRRSSISVPVEVKGMRKSRAAHARQGTEFMSNVAFTQALSGHTGWSIQITARADGSLWNAQLEQAALVALKRWRSRPRFVVEHLPGGWSMRCEPLIRPGPSQVMGPTSLANDDHEQFRISQHLCDANEQLAALGPGLVVFFELSRVTGGVDSRVVDQLLSPAVFPHVAGVLDFDGRPGEWGSLRTIAPW